MNAKVEIDPGVCGFQTVVRAVSADDQNVTFDIVADCEKLRAVAKALQAHGPVDAYAEMDSSKPSALLDIVRSRLKGCCAGCAAPVGIFKGMQVAAGLALPKDLSVKIAQE